MNYGFTLMLREGPDVVADYVHAHANVWPEVVTELRRSGVRDMQIYLHERRLFMWLDVPDDYDPASEFASLVEEPGSREWDHWMRTLQEPVAGAEEGEWWAKMKPVFRLADC